MVSRGGHSIFSSLETTPLLDQNSERKPRHFPLNGVSKASKQFHGQAFRENCTPAGKASNSQRNKRDNNYSFSLDHHVEEIDKLINRETAFIPKENSLKKQGMHTNTNMFWGIDGQKDTLRVGGGEEGFYLHLHGNLNHREKRQRGNGFQKNVEEFFGIEPQNDGMEPSPFPLRKANGVFQSYNERSERAAGKISGEIRQNQEGVFQNKRLEHLELREGRSNWPKEKQEMVDRILFEYKLGKGQRNSGNNSNQIFAYRREKIPHLNFIDSDQESLFKL